MTHAPRTLEGHQAWEAALHATGLRAGGRILVPSTDRAAAIGAARDLGYDVRAVAWLVTAIATGVEAAAHALLQEAADADRS